MERKQAKQEAALLGAMDRCAFATRWETPFRLGKLLQIYARERIWVLFQPNVFGFVNLHVLTRVDHPVPFCTSVVFFCKHRCHDVKLQRGDANVSLGAERANAPL